MQNKQNSPGSNKVCVCVRVCVQFLKFDEMLIAKYVAFSMAGLQFAFALFNVQFVEFVEKFTFELPLAKVMEFLIFVHFKNFFQNFIVGEYFFKNFFKNFIVGDCTVFGKHVILYEVFVFVVPNFEKSQVKPQVLGASMYKRTSR